MTFVENLRRLRLEQFLSQRELARRSGLHPVTLTRLEAGAAAPSTRSVRALAATLGVEPRELTRPDEVAELRRVLRPPGMVEPTAGRDAPALASAVANPPQVRAGDVHAAHQEDAQAD